MGALSIVENDLSDEIVSIYNQIKDLPATDYREDRKTYETFADKLKEHNSEVKRINKTVDAWSFEKVLDDPHAVERAYIDKCSDIAKLIYKFKKKDKSYEIFQCEVLDVSNNLDEICRQFDLHEKYLKLFSFPKGQYIDISQKNYVKDESNKIVVSILDSSEEPYYIFDKHDLIDTIVKEHNEAFIKEKSNKILFDDINGRSLDPEQRRAVLLDEKSVLVVAGAGSGKTLTICGKVEYLLKEKGVNPNDILLLSYSKKSADDLQTKVSNIDKNLTVGTFHKIGLDILKETQSKTFMVEDQYKAIIEEYFREEMKNRPHMLQKILKYYGLYISSTKHDKRYRNEGDLYEDLMKSDFSTLKVQLLSLTNDINTRETIKKELVKSFEEMAIANWYFINGIDYIYEAPYEHNVATNEKRQYMPDFKLKNYPIYHEHYGINKDGEASQFMGFEGVAYVEGMKWKQETHHMFGTDCIETYSYEFEDGTIFTKLEKELKKRGVEFHPLSSEEISNALNSIYESRLFKSFISLVSTFLSLYKASYRDDSAFETLKKSSFRNNYEKSRASLFLDIVKDLYH